MTSYFSLEKITPTIFVHEIAHALLEGNQYRPISSRLHEAVAQWVEKEVFKQ